MRYFTVKDIADLLSTNPETVRRWIRDGKLEAVQASRKDGNVIGEKALNDFLLNNPKYASMAAGGIAAIGLLGVVGLSVISSTAIVNKLITDKKLTENALVDPKELERYIQSTVEDCKKTIKEKEEQISSIQSEIEAENQRISELQSALNKIEVLSGSK